MAEKSDEAVRSAAAVPADDGAVAGRPTEATTRRDRTVVAAYALGLGVQVVFWCLIFLALALAIGVGGHLTEFRYVGF